MDGDSRRNEVVAGVCYVVPGREPLYQYMYDPPDGSATHNCDYETRLVRIADARPLGPSSVHDEGFELHGAPSATRDFRDDDEVRRVYYAECAELARTVVGGERCYVFDHQVRRREAGHPPLTFGRHGDGRSPAAAGRSHNDYTENSGRRRLELVVPDAGERTAIGRYCIVNVWRSIGGPIVDTPLALCAAPTVAASDLKVAEIRYPTRSGEIYLLAPAERHRWFYHARMDRHEALVFKQYDSRTEGVARFTPHVAFDLPEIPADAPLRESIEVRCLVVIDEHAGRWRG